MRNDYFVENNRRKIICRIENDTDFRRKKREKGSSTSTDCTTCQPKPKSGPFGAAGGQEPGENDPMPSGEMPSSPAGGVPLPSGDTAAMPDQSEMPAQ